MTRPHLLLSRTTADALQARFEPFTSTGRLAITVMPGDGEAPLTDEQLAAVTCAYFSRDLHHTPSTGGAQSTRTFFKTVERAPHLRWLQIFFAGVSSITTVAERLQARGTQITTATGAAAEPIAQDILAAVLAFSRGWLHHLASQRRGVWQPLADAQVPAPLEGQVATVVGMGAIGQEATRLLRGFGLRVQAVRQSDTPTAGCERTVPYERLHELLPETDWLILACPLTEQTRGLVSATALAALKPTAHLVNIARGDVVDEAALLDTLASRRIAGAYLDVFSKEPLPADSPFWALDNVVITPHNAGTRNDYVAQVDRIFLDNLQRFIDGQPLTRLAIRGA